MHLVGWTGLDYAFDARDDASYPSVWRRLLAEINRPSRASQVVSDFLPIADILCRIYLVRAAAIEPMQEKDRGKRVAVEHLLNAQSKTPVKGSYVARIQGSKIVGTMTSIFYGQNQASCNGNDLDRTNDTL